MGHLLQNSPTLKSLNLKGNQIQAIGCEGIGYGLQQRQEPLEFLGEVCEFNLKSNLKLKYL